MYNVSFGTEQQPVIKFPAAIAGAQQQPQAQVQTAQPGTNNVINIAPQVDTFTPETKTVTTPDTPQTNTTQRPNIMLFPMSRQMTMKPPEKKFDWDNFYRIAGLATSVILTILIGLSLKPMIGRYFKKNSSDLFTDLNKKNVIDFDKLPGMKEPKQEFIDEVINPIKYKDLYESEGLYSNLYCILYGPPGTGKTNFVYSAAKKLNAKLAEFKLGKEGSGVIYETGNNLQAKADAVIAHAKKNPDQEYFILFDEVDSVLSEIKNPISGADQERSSIARVFQQLMDDFLPYKNIKIFATTNMTRNINTGDIGNMSSAVIERFRTKIYVGNPDAEAIENALKLYLGERPMAKKLLESKEDIAEIAAALVNASYRNIDYIIKKACKNTMKQRITGLIKGKKPKDIMLTKETFMKTIRDFERTNKKLNIEAIEVPTPLQATARASSQIADEVITEAGNVAETVKPKNNKLTPEEREAIKKEIREILKRRKTTKKTNNAN